MPQMMPMMWTMYLFLILLSLMFLIPPMYFSSIPSLKKKKLSLSYNLWDWKW